MKVCVHIKSTLAAAVLLAAVGWTASAVASDESPAASVAAIPAADKAAITSVLSAYEAALNASDTEAVRRLVLALQNGEVLVEAIDTQTHERVRLPPGFWWGWILGKDGTAATLQALQGGRRVRPVYLDPRLVIPQPETEPKRLVWRIAEELLSAGEGPPRGHGRQIRLARMVQPKLKAAGYGDLKDNTVADYLRDSLREWEAKHPG